MRYSMIVTFFLLIFVFLMAIATWLEEQSQKIDALNKQYVKDIKKLHTIAQINSFLESEIVPFIVDEQNNSTETDKKLIYFFDENQNRYNLLIEKFIYEGDSVKSIDLSYAMERGKKDLLNDFLSIEHKDGFLQFREFKLSAKELSGRLQVAQPYSMQISLSQDRGVEDDLLE